MCVCVCGGLWKDCGTGRASFCHAYLLFACDPPFCSLGNLLLQLGARQWPELCTQISFAYIRTHTHTQTHVTATEVHPSPRPFHQYEATFFFACSWSFGGNCPRLSVERQKSSQNSKCNYWERHRLVWGDTAIWREKRKAGAVAAPSKNCNRSRSKFAGGNCRRSRA